MTEITYQELVERLGKPRAEMHTEGRFQDITRRFSFFPCGCIVEDLSRYLMPPDEYQAWIYPCKAHEAEFGEVDVTWGVVYG